MKAKIEAWLKDDRAHVDMQGDVFGLRALLDHLHFKLDCLCRVKNAKPKPKKRKATR
jgi:hypothetical protein